MNRFLRRTFTIDRTARVIFSLLILLALFYALISIWEVILPFLLAGIFAYIMMPLVRFVQYRLRLRSRALSVITIVVLLTAIVSLGVTYLVPMIKEELSKTMISLQAYNDGEGVFKMVLPKSIIPYFEKYFNPEVILQALDFEKISETLRSLMGQMGTIVSGTLSVFSLGLVFVMGLVYFLLIMIDFEGLAHGFLDLVPASLRPSLKATMIEADYYMNSYFRGQSLVALSVGILLTIGFNLIGLPMATAMGIFIGLLNFIPYMQALGILPLSFCALLMGLQQGTSIWFCLFLAYGILFIVQVIQDAILVPRIMGHKMGMRPSLILLSLAVWGYLLGFFGLLIALPMTMVIYSIYMRYVLEDAKYIEETDKRLKNYRVH